MTEINLGPQLQRKQSLMTMHVYRRNTALLPHRLLMGEESTVQFSLVYLIKGTMHINKQNCKYARISPKASFHPQSPMPRCTKGFL